jgi:hypothetical protein
MPDVDAIIQYGPFPATGALLDEPDLLVQSVSFKPTREKKEHKGGNQCVQALRYTNPMMTIAFKAIISEYAGLADQHPGTLVTDLLNYASPVHGFDPTQGILVYEDPDRSLDIDNPAEVSFNVVQYPFVESA